MKPLDLILRDWRFRMRERHISGGSAVLDIGGGDGAFLRRISGRIESGACIDPLAKDCTEGNVVIMKSRAGGRLPFPDESFDVVSLLAVYEHLGHLRELITSEVDCVLKPGGLGRPHRAGHGGRRHSQGARHAPSRRSDDAGRARTLQERRNGDDLQKLRIQSQALEGIPDRPEQPLRLRKALPGMKRP